MPSFMFYMNAFHCEQFARRVKQHNIIVPIKYVEKGLLNDSQSDFDEFYESIKERLIVANLTEKTRSRYLRGLEADLNNLELLFNYVQSIV
mgnify:CR=1 FL=1